MGFAFQRRDGTWLRQPSLRGMATRFATPHSAGDGTSHVFARGAFDGLTGSAEFRIGHDPDRVAGHAPGDLQIFSDRTGLRFTLDLGFSPLGPTVAAMVAEGEWRQMSVGFTPLAADEFEIDGNRVRVVTKALLVEISLVRQGAVPGTSVELFDAAAEADQAARDEALVREAEALVVAGRSPSISAALRQVARADSGDLPLASVLRRLHRHRRGREPVLDRPLSLPEPLLAAA